MEMIVATNSLPNTQANVVSGKTQGGKAAGKGGFDAVLQTAGDGQGVVDDKKQSTDGLLAAMAVMAGGLSPLLAMQQQTGLTQAAGQEGSQGLVANVTLGAQQLQVALQRLSLTNGELASLLQKFGASSQLMGVLLGKPTGAPVEALLQHPEVMADLENALSALLQQATQAPQTLAQDPKLATLLQAMLSESSASTTTSVPEPTATSTDANKTPTLLGKLQATLTAHSTVQGQADAGAGKQQSGSDAKEGESSQSFTSVWAGIQPQTQPLHQQLKPVQQQVITLNANKFNSEFADLVVKKAALIESPGRQEFRIVLQPQGLGEIEVRVEAVGKQISLHFTADNANAKGLLDAGMANLKSQLQAQGIQYNRIEVSSGNTSSSDLYSGLPQDRGQNGNGQPQGDAGKGSNKRGTENKFSIDEVGEIAASTGEDLSEADGIDVTA